jgi:hypothetical protein
MSWGSSYASLIAFDSLSIGWLILSTDYILSLRCALVICVWGESLAYVDHLDDLDEIRVRDHLVVTAKLDHSHVIDS